MAVRIIHNEDGAALYCSTDMEAFGPLFDTLEEAEDFLDWLPDDARRLSPGLLRSEHSRWHASTHDRDGEFVGRELHEPTDEEVTRRGPHIMDARSENDRSL